MTNVIEWLETAAATKPDAIFVSDEQEAISFGEALARAKCYGTAIAQICPSLQPVAFLMEKSAEATCALLGCVMAGCPYSFIDLRQPANRVAQVLGTLKPGLLLSNEAYLNQAQDVLDGTQTDADGNAYATDLHGGAMPFRLLSHLTPEANESLLASRRKDALDTDPLYINFTSGSTGTPKGVAVCHRSVIDFIVPFTSIFGLSEHDRFANQAPFDFDVSVKDLYGALYLGAQLHLIPRGYFSEPVKLMDFLADREVTVCTWAVSAMCFVSIMGGFDYRVPTSIRRVIFSGEVMPPKQLLRWQEALPEALFANVYGPTEITCNCSYHIITRRYGPDEVIPAGVAFPNERVVLLDAEDREVTAAGERGEICVMGTCLALGYYGEPELSAAAFVQNPLQTTLPERMYRTGDLGYWDEQGELVYAGRKDHQIKHLGQRIELGEIEAQAQSIEGVSRACCLYNDRRKRLELFYCGVEESASVTQALGERLPGYMVPGKIRRLDEMPLTKNGKIDRSALAAMK